MQERKAASAFRKYLRQELPEVKIYVDRDFLGRMHRSEWDYFLFSKERLIFIEEKVLHNTGFPEKGYAENLLESGQKKGLYKAIKSGSVYMIIVNKQVERKLIKKAYVFSSQDIDILEGSSEILSFFKSYFEVNNEKL